MTRRRRGSCCATARARCSSHPATLRRWRRRCAGSPAIPSSRARSAPAGSRPTASRRARPSSARAGSVSSSGSSRAVTPAVVVWAGGRRLRRRLRNDRRAQAPRLRERPLRPRQHDAGGLVDRPRRRALGHGRARRADLAARLALRPDPRPAGAALVALARPGAAARRPGDRRRLGGAAGLLARPQAPPRGLAGGCARPGLSPLGSGAVADRERLPPGGARVPAAPVRVVAARPGPALGIRAARGGGDRDEGARGARRGGDGHLVRRAPPRPQSRSGDRPDRRRLRPCSQRSSSSPTSRPAAPRPSRAATSRRRSTAATSPISPPSCCRSRCSRSPARSRCSPRCRSSG